MEIHSIVELQRDFFKSKKTYEYSFRKNALNKLREAILKYEDALKEALFLDLGKSYEESYMTEIGIVLKEISHMEKSLKKMMKTKRVRTAIVDFPSKSYRQAHPYGNVLIISPWNYPVNLTLTPLIGAIAAGNTAIIKPSEFSHHTSKVLSSMIAETFDADYITVVNGGVETNQALLNEKFNYIFFTGSTAVGKIVMEKASKHLTPISLELGGKSPVIVDESAKIKMAAKRIVFGKHLNSGQTCIAPDYLFIHKKVKDEFIMYYEKYVNDFYGTYPLTSSHYSSIINQKHFNRVRSYLKDGEIVFGGQVDEATSKIAPTILVPESMDTPVMTEEIFGPILPIIEFEQIEEVIDIINDRAHPLAFYLFSESKKVQDKVLNECQFGGGCINDTINHIASDYLPFGGVGESGMGSYHGTTSFETFSHYKSVLKKATWFDLHVRYLPHNKEKSRIIKYFLR